MLRRRVIERELFARRDRAAREEEHVAVHHPAETIRIAGVIDERGRIAATTRINAPAIVELANSHLAAVRHSSRGFTIADLLAQQLADLPPCRQRDERETAFAVNPRLPDLECAAIRVHFAAG